MQAADKLNVHCRHPNSFPEEFSTLEVMADGELNPTNPACLYLISAFLALEPTDCLISLARGCDGGVITKRVQRFIWEHCISKAASGCNGPNNSYLKNFVKKIIANLESNCEDVMDELYEQYAYYMISLKDDNSMKEITRICKVISFLFPDGCCNAWNLPMPTKFAVTLQCSENMLEGDTGCSIWPSSLFLSEYILSYPEIFSNKSCFEVGSGVGLVGVCLAHVKASQVILSDGDLSSLANLNHNMELNQLRAKAEVTQKTNQDFISVECKHIPWESPPECELQDVRPDIVLGADVIYDPLCLPHLIHLLEILLNPNKSSSRQKKDVSRGSLPNGRFIENVASYSPDFDQGRASCCTYSGANDHSCESTYQGQASYNGTTNPGYLIDTTKETPVAYIATVIRNKDTFNYFLKLAEQAQLTVRDISEMQKPMNLLPYMKSYDRCSIKLFTISYYCK